MLNTCRYAKIFFICIVQAGGVAFAATELKETLLAVLLREALVTYKSFGLGLGLGLGLVLGYGLGQMAYLLT